jgi:hypothetical protein
VVFSGPRGKLKINTGLPGEGGFLGSGTLIFTTNSVQLSNTERIPEFWKIIGLLLIIAALFHLVISCYFLHHMMGPILTLPLSSIFLLKKAVVLRSLLTISEVAVTGNQVRFISGGATSGSRSVNLRARNNAEAEEIGRKLNGESN